MRLPVPEFSHGIIVSVTVLISVQMAILSSYLDFPHVSGSVYGEVRLVSFQSLLTLGIHYLVVG